jgi:ribokinase
LSQTQIAVVGHCEWTEFARVPRVPEPGDIVQASDAWEQIAGGGAVAAVQIAKLTGSCLFLTALADDELGHRAARDLAAMGVEVAATWGSEPQRRAFVFLDDAGERTITTIGERAAPAGGDDLPWQRLGEVGGVYFTAGDAAALRAARTAGALVATVRAGAVLSEAGVELDALVRSARDQGEAYRAGDLEPAPRAVVVTVGASGGRIETADGEATDWEAAPLPGTRVDVHGAGDSFAAGLTVGLGEGMGIADAVALAARCGAACVTGRGPYEGQLRRSSEARARR